jgi:hypothetical protein
MPSSVYGCTSLIIIIKTTNPGDDDAAPLKTMSALSLYLNNFFPLLFGTELLLGGKFHATQIIYRPVSDTCAAACGIDQQHAVRHETYVSFVRRAHILSVLCFFFNGTEKHLLLCWRGAGPENGECFMDCRAHWQIIFQIGEFATIHKSRERNLTGDLQGDGFMASASPHFISVYKRDYYCFLNASATITKDVKWNWYGETVLLVIRYFHVLDALCYSKELDKICYVQIQK